MTVKFNSITMRSRRVNLESVAPRVKVERQPQRVDTDTFRPSKDALAKVQRHVDRPLDNGRIAKRPSEDPSLRAAREMTDRFEVGPALVPGRALTTARALAPKPSGPPQVPSSPPVPSPPSNPTGPSLSSRVKGKAPQKDLDLDLMKMSSESYNLDGAGDKYAQDLAAHGWARLKEDASGRILDRNGKPTGLTKKDIEDPDSGFRAAVYENDKGEVVVAFAGTDGVGDFPDVSTDIMQGLGLETTQFNKAQALAAKVKQAYGDNVAFTGHSLGGGLASAASVATGNPAVTFNAAGLSDGAIRAMGQNPYEARQRAEQGQIRTYQIQGDPLTGVQNGTLLGLNLLSGMPDAMGHKLNLKDPNASPLAPDVAKAHFQDTLVKALSTETPTEEPSPLGNPVGMFIEDAERGVEGLVDLAGAAINETLGLGNELLSVAGRMAPKIAEAAQNDLAQGKVAQGTAKIAGAILSGGLEIAGDAGDRVANLGGRAVEDLGQFVAKGLNQHAQFLGVPDAGKAVAGVVDQAAEFVGQGLDRAGDGMKSAAQTMAAGTAKAAEVAGTVFQQRVDGVVDLAGAGLNELNGLSNDILNVGGRVAQEVAELAKNDLLQGKIAQGTARIAGEVLSGDLEFAGDAIDRVADLGGRAVEELGQVTAKDAEQLGQLFGVPDAGKAVAEGVDKTAKLVGQSIDRAGDGVRSAARGMGEEVEKVAGVAGTVAQAVSSFLNPFD